MTPIDQKKEENITSSELIKKTTKANDIKNFMVSGRFKKEFVIKKKPKNKMAHLIPKKKKRKK